MWTLKKEDLLAAGVGLATIGAVIASAGVLNRWQRVTRQTERVAAPTQAAATPGPNARQSETVSYKVARTVRSSREGNKLYLDISVEPQYFVRDKMVALARQLNRDYAEELRLVATILDDEDMARHFNPIGHSYRLYKEVERGQYYLDRVRGEEYIQFSTERGRPTAEIRIKLGSKLAKKSKGRD